MTDEQVTWTKVADLPTSPTPVIEDGFEDGLRVYYVRGEAGVFMCFDPFSKSPQWVRVTGEAYG